MFEALGLGIIAYTTDVILSISDSAPLSLNTSHALRYGPLALVFKMLKFTGQLLPTSLIDDRVFCNVF
jgi:hypothetical protein